MPALPNQAQEAQHYAQQLGAVEEQDQLRTLLKKLIELEGVAQNKIAGRLNISLAAMSNIINGKKREIVTGQYTYNATSIPIANYNNAFPKVTEERPAS
jgi:transcriptional regulator with XRE-family HTH domain